MAETKVLKHTNPRFSITFTWTEVTTLHANGKELIAPYLFENEVKLLKTICEIALDKLNSGEKNQKEVDNLLKLYLDNYPELIRIIPRP